MKYKLDNRKLTCVLCYAICAFAFYGLSFPIQANAAESAQNLDDVQQSSPAATGMESKAVTNTVDPFSGYISLYADHRARRVGDIVTIIVTESSKASKSSATQTSKKSGSNGSLSDFFGLGGMPIEMGVDAGSDYTGSGSTTRSGSMEAKISATVKQVLPNGSLMLEGTRQVTVNDDDQIITVSGIVRPQDIRSDNSVLSMYMADARIEYVGNGPIAQKPGIVTRIIQTPFHWVAGIFRKIF